MPSHRFTLNLLAMALIGAGALLSLVPALGVEPRLQGALWGALIAWFAATRANGA